MSENPYQSPLPAATAVAEPAAAQPIALFYIEGNSIIVRNRDVLPPICVKSGQRVAAREMVKKRFSWAPSWVPVLFLAGPLIWIIVYLNTRQYCKLTYGLSREARSEYRKWIGIKAAICAGFFAAMYGAFAIHLPQWGMLGMIIFIVSLIACFFGNSPLSISKHENGEFWFTGASPEFLAAVQSYAQSAA